MLGFPRSSPGSTSYDPCDFWDITEDKGPICFHLCKKSYWHVCMFVLRTDISERMHRNLPSAVAFWEGDYMKKERGYVKKKCKEINAKLFVTKSNNNNKETKDWKLGNDSLWDFQAYFLRFFDSMKNSWTELGFIFSSLLLAISWDKLHIFSVSHSFCKNENNIYNLR